MSIVLDSNPCEFHGVGWISRLVSIFEHLQGAVSPDGQYLCMIEFTVQPDSDVMDEGDRSQSQVTSYIYTYIERRVNFLSV